MTRRVVFPAVAVLVILLFTGFPRQLSAQDADLAVLLDTVPASPVDASAALQWQIHVHNLESSTAAADPEMVFNLPAEAAYGGVTAPGDWSCSVSLPEITCTAASIAASTEVLITIDSTAPADPGASFSMTGSADIDASTADSDTSNNHAESNVAVTAHADLSMSGAFSPSPVDAASAVDLQLSISNAGPSTAASPVVGASVPAGFSYQGYSGTGWSCTESGGSVSCSRDSLASGASAPLSLSFLSSDEGGNASSNLTISSDTDDPDASDNAATAAVTVNAHADLGITMDDDPDPVDAAGNLEYDIEISNEGPSTATGVSLSFTPDAQSTYSGFSGTGFACTDNGATIDCTGPDLAPSATAALTITVTAPDEPAVLSASVTASSAVADPDAANNTATEETSMTAVADLGVTIDDGVLSARPGSDSLDITVSVSNDGPGAVEDAKLSVVLPEDLISARFTCSAVSGTASCEVAGGKGAPDLDLDLEAGARIEVLIHARIAEDAGGVACGSGRCLDLRVSVSTPATVADHNAANDSDADTDTELLFQSACSISKDDGISEVSPGENFEYLLRASNLGPATVRGLHLTDVFPPELLGDAARCSADPSRPCWSCTEPAPMRAVERFEENIGGVVGMQGPAAVVTTPDGAWVFVAGRMDDSIVTFSRSGAVSDFGHLSVAGVTNGIADVRALEIGPEGSTLYAAGDDLIAAFSIDPVTGALTEIGRWVNGTAPITRMLDPVDLVVSPDGLNLYAAAADADALIIFSRDPASGLLTYADIVESDAATLLSGVSSLAMTSHGRFLYAAAPTDDAVTGFARNPADGSLSLVASWTFSGVSGIGGLAFEPDDGRLIAAAAGSGTVLVLLRDITGGQLIESQRFEDGVNGVTGLQGVRHLVITPDGRSLIAVSPPSDRMAVFLVDPATRDWKFDRSVDAAALGLADLDSPSRPCVDPLGRQLLLPAESSSTLDVIELTLDVVCPAIEGSGNIDLDFDLPAGARLEYRAMVRLDPSASGSVSNTATITPPAGVDSDASDDSSTDTDTIVVATDLEITIDDQQISATPGRDLETTITVHNAGTIAADGTVVSSDPPIYDGTTVTAGFDAASITWTCVASGGACCTSGGGNCGSEPSPVTGTGAISQLVDLPPAGSLVFRLHGTIDEAATGTLLQEASLTMPAGIGDPDPGDNTASDQDTVLFPEPDLEVYKSHSAPIAGADWRVDWELTVHNRGPSTAVGAEVEDILPPEIDAASASWTCSVSGGGSCGDASGTGNIQTTVDLSAGASALFELESHIANSVTAPVSNTVTASAAGDPVGGNNRYTDTVQIGISADLTLDLDDGLTTAVPGEDLVYALEIKNEGPTAVEGAALDSLLPDALKNISWTCSSTTPIPGDLHFLEMDSHAGATTAPAGLAISPDGSMVYVAARGDDALAVFTRETTQGSAFNRLSFIEAEYDGQDDPNDSGVTVDGLAGAAAVAVSPDGDTIYVAAADDDAVSVFHFVAPSSSVSFVEVELNGVDDPGDSGTEVSGLAGAAALAVSPDGKNLYVVGADDNAVAVFDIASGTGRLSFRQAVTQGDLGGVGLGTPSAVAVSPDGAHVLVSASGDHSLCLFARSDADGSLSLVDTEVEGVNDASDSGGPVAGMTAAADVAVSPDGASVYVAGPTADRVVAFDLDADELSFSAAFDPGVAPLNPGQPGVSSLAVSADGEHLAAGQAGQDTLVIFRRNGTALISESWYRNHLPPPPDVPVNGLGGLSDVEFAPDGLAVLASGANDDGIAIFDREGPQPELPQIEVEFDNIDDPGDTGSTVDGLFGAWDVAVSGDGEHVYVAGFGDDALSIFKRDASKGQTPASRGQHLVFQGILDSSTPGGEDIDGPVALSFGPEPLGSTLYLVNRESGSLYFFERNTDHSSPDFGDLSFKQDLHDGIGQIAGMAGASDVALNPAGNLLFVAGRWAASIVVFDRSTLGTLTFNRRIQDGIDGISGLAGVTALAVSADGAHLYAAAAEADDVLVFSIGHWGNLRLIQTVNAVQFPQGFSEPSGIALSPDSASAHVAIACRSGNALLVASRDSDPTSETYGFLEPLQSFVDGSDGVSGLRGARSVAFSSDGGQVYVGAEYDDSLVVYSRDDNPAHSTFGRLQLIEVRTKGVGGVRGLGQPYGLAGSPDGRNVYVASLGDNSLAAFARRGGSSCSEAGSGNIHDVVDLGFLGTLSYRITGTIDPAATGTLEASATISVPSGAVDSDPSSNSDDDQTDLTPAVSLSMSKDDHVASTVSGEELSWSLRVENSGPSDARNVTITDVPPGADFDSITWTCDASGAGRLSRIDGVNGDDFEGVTSVAMLADPDGAGPLEAAAVAVSVSRDSLMLLDRDASSGRLTPRTTLHEGDDVGGTTLDGLEGARAVVASSDGLFVYVAAQTDDAVSVFGRDLGSGELLPVDLERDGFNGVDGLDRVVALRLSADEKFLYTAGENDDAVAVFSRDAVSGELYFLEVEREGVNDGSDAGGTVFGLDGASDLDIDPVNGDTLYVSASVSGAVALFRRDPATGLLSFVTARDGSSTTGLEGAASVEVAPDGKRVLAAGRDADAVVVFSRDDNSGSSGYGLLSPLQVFSRAGDLVGPADTLFSTDGESVLVAAAASGRILLLRSEDDEGRLAFVEKTGGDDDPLAGVISLTASEDASILYSAASIEGEIGIWGRSSGSSCPAAGSGPLNGVAVEVAASGSLNILLHARVRPDAVGIPCPDDDSLRCVANSALVQSPEDSDSSDDLATDTDLLGRHADLEISKSDHHAIIEGLDGAAAVVSSPDGRFLWTAAAASNAIALFERDADPASPNFGQPVYRGVWRNNENGVSGLDGVRALAVSPDGAHLYAAAATAGAVVVFRIDAQSGRLNFVEKISNGSSGAAGLAGASDVLVSSDGTHVYVAGAHQNAVVVLRRENDAGDPDFGRLETVQVLIEGQDGIEGLVAVRSLALVEERFYALSPAGSVAIFRRTPSSGQLEFLDAVFDGSDDISGLGGGEDILAVDDLLYVAAPSPGSVVVLGVDENDVVHFIEKLDAETTAGLGGVDALGLSPDGRYLYTAAADDALIGVFGRGAGDGRLSFIETAAPPGSGLAGASSVAVCEEHLYAVSSTDRALVSFDRSSGPGTLSYREQLVEGGGGVAAGSELSYTITVSNNGPSDAAGMRVSDVFPPEISAVSWQCSGSGGGACPAEGSGGIDTLVDIPAGASVSFIATGVLRPDFEGMISNTARVATAGEPPGVIDLDPSNNTATDADTLVIASADLGVAFVPPAADPSPGEVLDFGLVVSNAGDSSAPSSELSVLMAEALSDVSWSCTARPAPGLLLPVQQSLPVDQPSAVALSPAGDLLVAAGYLGGTTRPALAFMAVDPGTGALSPLDLVVEGEGQDTDGDGTDDVVIEGLRGASDLVFAPDGRFVYVAASAEDAVSWFEVSSSSLLYRGIARDGIGGFRDLGDVSGLEIDPAGSMLYAVSPASGQLAAMSRDIAGGLAWTASVGVGTGISEMVGARAVAADAGGSYLYISAADSVVTLRTSDLGLVQTLSEGEQPGGSGSEVITGLDGGTGVAVSSGLVAVTSSDSGGSVVLFSRNAADGSLEYSGHLSEGETQDGVLIDALEGACAPVFGADGDQLYVAARAEGAVTLLRNDLAQKLKFVARFDAASGHPGLDDVRDLAIGSRQLFAAGGTTGSLDVFETAAGGHCPESGRGAISAMLDLPPGATAEFSVTGRVAASANDDLVFSAEVDPADTVRDPDISNNRATMVLPLGIRAGLSIVKTDGKTEMAAGEINRYEITVSNAGPADVRGITVTDVLPAYPAESAGFAQSTASWNCLAGPPLELVQTMDDPAAGLGGVRGMILAGDFLYSASADDDAVTVFERDAGTGELSFVQVVAEGDTSGAQEIAGLGGVSALALSSDDGFLYAAGTSDSSIVVFTRDDGNGRLSYLDTTDASEGPGLGGVRDLLVAGDLLYAAGSTDRAIVIFEIGDDGRLSYLRRAAEGVDGIPLEALDGVTALSLDPAGEFLYAAASAGEAISVFERSSSDGSLSWVQTLFEGDAQTAGLAEVEGLGLVQDLVLSPDASLVLTVSLAGDALCVFSRDVSTGRLEQIQRLGDPEMTDGASALVISSDGGMVYLTAVNNDAVSLFRRDWSTDLFAPAGHLGSEGSGPGGMEDPAGILLAAGGDQLIVGASTSISVFRRLALASCDLSADDLSGEAVIDLEAGASVQLTVEARVHPASRGILSNTAGLTPPSGVDDDPSDNLSTDTTTLNVAADLGISKSDGVDTVVAGRPLSWEIVVSNDGPSDLDGATVSDTPPAVCGGVSWSCTPSAGAACGTGGPGGISDVISIPVGSSVLYTLSCTPAPDASGELLNTATVTPPAGVTDPDLSNNEASDLDALVGVSNFFVTKTDGVDELIPGENVGWTITVGNAGPSAGSARVLDLIPGAVSSASWSCSSSSGGSCPAAGTGSIDTMVDLPVGATVVFNLSGMVSPAARGSLSNTVSVTPEAGLTDPDSSDNRATDTDTLRPTADLMIDKADIADPVPLEGEIDYQITVSNLGPSDARDVVISDVLPAGLSLISTTGCAEDPAGVSTCTLGTMGVGSSRVLDLRVRADAGFEGTVTNTAAVSSSAEDPVSGNNSDSEDTTVIPFVDLHVELRDQPDPVAHGWELLYTIDIDNSGPDPARDVVLSGDLPDGLSLLESLGCTEDPLGSPDCSLGVLAAGESREMTLKLLVDADPVRVLHYEVAAATSSHETDESDNSDAEDTTVGEEVSLSISKDDGFDIVGTGNELQYRIVVRNSGPADAVDVDISDILPPELLDGSWSCTPSGAALCTPSGTGNIVDTVSIPVDDSLLYELRVRTDPAVDTARELTNTARLTTAPDQADSDASNDTASDTDLLIPGLIFLDGFERGDTTAWSGTTGLSPDIFSDGFESGNSASWSASIGMAGDVK